MAKNEVVFTLELKKLHMTIKYKTKVEIRRYSAFNKMLYIVLFLCFLTFI